MSRVSSRRHLTDRLIRERLEVNPSVAAEAVRLAVSSLGLFLSIAMSQRHQPVPTNVSLTLALPFE
ncbi:MAG: hypothetical protein A4E19_13185 [Nitrospira sp. SG-bin1]|nr:MAG: hypothetical protein A4E19_13185 [Nitrospira sp. SG-bin1]